MMLRAVTDGSLSDEVVEVINPSGTGAFVIVCEHASNFIPAEYGGLGLDEAVRASHIAWDPGALAVAETLSARLDAPLVAQRVSRLLYDCNRPPEAAAAMPAVSEVYPIPGNAGLSPVDRQARTDRFYAPFRDTLAACIDRRIEAGCRPAIITVHSFTPVFKGARRSTELGILHDTDTRFADALLEATKTGMDLNIERNQPYGPADGVTHTLLEHGITRGLLNVMLETRNDLLETPASQTEIGEWLARCASEALDKLKSAGGREIA
jgi:predicted N-formylglutamate amidohydrolase